MPACNKSTIAVALCQCAILLTAAASMAGLPAEARPKFMNFWSKNNSPALTIDDAQIIAAQSQQAEKVELTVTAPIKKLLKEEDYREPHQRFLLILSNGSTVLVANDLQYGTFVPAQAGDLVRIHGEYIWNEKGGVLHWTHKSDEPNHESGWIDFNGKRYQ